ncbi:hypothetical protein [Bradyrhizobium sp. CCBAU 53351]|nr:hypothetical protein [Bradyrhizobium sp. CCBAU 53351]
MNKINGLPIVEEAVRFIRNGVAASGKTGAVPIIPGTGVLNCDLSPIDPA